MVTEGTQPIEGDATDQEEANSKRRYIGVDERAAVTMRLPKRLIRDLRRVVADRRTHQIEPYLQQEIVAEALGEWLKKNS